MLQDMRDKRQQVRARTRAQTRACVPECPGGVEWLVMCPCPSPCLSQEIDQVKEARRIEVENYRDQERRIKELQRTAKMLAGRETCRFTLWKLTRGVAACACPSPPVHQWACMLERCRQSRQCACRQSRRVRSDALSRSLSSFVRALGE